MPAPRTFGPPTDLLAVLEQRQPLPLTMPELTRLSRGAPSPHPRPAPSREVSRHTVYYFRTIPLHCSCGSIHQIPQGIIAHTIINYANVSPLKIEEPISRRFVPKGSPIEYLQSAPQEIDCCEHCINRDGEAVALTA